MELRYCGAGSLQRTRMRHVHDMPRRGRNAEEVVQILLHLNLHVPAMEASPSQWAVGTKPRIRTAWGSGACPPKGPSDKENQYLNRRLSLKAGLRGRWNQDGSSFAHTRLLVPTPKAHAHTTPSTPRTCQGSHDPVLTRETSGYSELGREGIAPRWAFVPKHLANVRLAALRSTVEDSAARNIAGAGMVCGTSSCTNRPGEPMQQ